MSHEAEVREHFNEPILLGDRLARVIGYSESDDCYIICRYPGGKIVHHTMVGGYTFLKVLRGQGLVISTKGEEWDDLCRLDRMLELNGCAKAPEFIVDLAEDAA